MTGDALLRLAVFGAVFAAMALWELAAPWRATPRRARWTANLLLLGLDTLLVRLAFPAAAVGFATLAAARGWGLLPRLDLPGPATVALAYLALDALIWLQHRVFHHVPWLWRLHRVHHSDTGFDVTTGVRFHPVEILLSMLVKGAAIVALGAPVAAVLLFETVLNASSLFNHGNVRLPRALEPLLRLVLVTPEMHRVHHSWHMPETNSNFGFTLPWWDRLFGTYVAASRDGADGLTIGLHEFREPAAGRPVALLLQPLRAATRPESA